MIIKLVDSEPHKEQIIASITTIDGTCRGSPVLHLQIDLDTFIEINFVEFTHLQTMFSNAMKEYGERND